MTKRALCIGINNYPGTANDLNGCVNDAHDWKSELEKRGFTTQIMLDAQATKANMMQAITELISATQKDDIAVLTFSGHGTWVPDKSNDEADQRDEALCAYDIHLKNYVSDDELYAVFKKKKRGAKIVFISDSCHSGSVARDLDAPADAPVPRYLDPSFFLSPEELTMTRDLVTAPVKRRAHTALLMSGCQDIEYSYDARINNRPNGAFTYYALSELKKLPPTASFEAWHKAIRTQLPSGKYPQSPNFEGSKTMKKWGIF
jgi:metacaspase-1